MKTTHLQRNKASTGKDIGKLSSSMLHSIRHESQYLKKDEHGNDIKMWSKEKSHLNFMMVGGVMVSLDSMSDDKKEQIVTDMVKDELADLAGENLDDELISQIQEQNKKVKKQASNLKRNKGLFADFSKLKDKHISDEDFSHYILMIDDDPEVKRKDQKFKSMKNFQQDNNKLVELREQQKDFKIDKNQGLIQESFLKFPQMPNGTITKEKHTAILEGYFKKFYPDYAIKGSFFHGDERSDNANLQDCGGHPHTFISCRNSKSGKYDLVKQQKLKAIEHIKNNPDDFPSINPDNLKSSYTLHKSPRDGNGNIIKQISAEHKAENREMSFNMRAMGKASQAMILAYGQEQLKNEGIELFRNDYKSDAEKERLKQMELDSKKSKHLRENNSHNSEIDAEKRELKFLKNQNKDLKDTNKRLDFMISGKEDSLSKLDNKAKELYELTMNKTQYDVKKYVDDNTDEINSMVEFCNQPENKKKLESMENKNWYKAFEIVDDAIKKPDSALRKVHDFAKKNILGYESIFGTFKEVFFKQYEQIKGKKHELDDTKKDDKLNKIGKKLDGFKENLPFGKGLTKAQIDGIHDKSNHEEEQTTTKKAGTQDADDYVKLVNQQIKERYKK